MNVIKVNTATPYEIRGQRGILTDAGNWCRTVNRGQKALIITDSNVAPLYADAVKTSLQQADYQTDVFVFEAGEQSKTLATVTEIYARIAQNRLSRTDLLVALGGGVTGDMTGFAAATWMRGMDFVQIPTTLLAQVDSSVGGKTGVDIPQGKNLVGAFWQPRLVLMDSNVLRTLPQAVFADGMAEVVKTACIKDAALFETLETGDLADDAVLDAVIAATVSIKRDVVERDERESGERKLLNFGHTLGHALEKYYGYSSLSHGSAVAIGSVRITAAAERQGLTAVGTAARIAALLARCGLPTADPTPVERLVDGMQNDKKRAGDHIDLALIRTIGDGFVHRVDASALGAFFAAGECV